MVNRLPVVMVHMQSSSSPLPLPRTLASTRKRGAGPSKANRASGDRRAVGMSLFSVGLIDFYIRCVAAGLFKDIRLL